MKDIQSRSSQSCIQTAFSLLKRVGQPIVSTIIEGVKKAPSAIMYCVNDYLSFLEKQKVAKNCNQEIRRSYKEIEVLEAQGDRGGESPSAQARLSELRTRVQDLAYLRHMVAPNERNVDGVIDRFEQSPFFSNSNPFNAA